MSESILTESVQVVDILLLTSKISGNLLRQPPRLSQPTFLHIDECSYPLNYQGCRQQGSIKPQFIGVLACYNNWDMNQMNDTVTKDEIAEIEEMVLENSKILAENNKLLKKLNRSNTVAFWLRIFWIAIILGVPFLLYYYIVAPYYQSLDEAFKFFGVELPNIPTWGTDPK